MGTSDSVMARKVHALERRLEAIERGQRYAHGGSIEDAALEVRDEGGSLRAIVGQLADGTTGVNVVNGPVPPTPTAPVVEPALAALAVTWDGTFADAQASPLDWMRVEVHIGPDPDYTPAQGTLRDTIESPQGGTVTVPLPYTEWFVKLRSRTSSGVASESTAAVAGTPRQAEAADITAGSIIAEHIAVDAITGKSITGGTVTGATVQTAETGARVTLDTHIKLYNDDGDLLAEATPSAQVAGGTYSADPAFICYNTYGFGSYWAMLSRGFLRFGREDLTYVSRPILDHIVAGGNVSQLILESGSIAADEARMVMSGSPDSTTVPYVRFSSDRFVDSLCDVEITGKLTVGGPVVSDNIRAQRSQTPAPGSAGGMSTVAVVFSNPMSSTPRVVATPDSSAGIDSTEIRWTVTNITTSGFTIQCYRSNNFATFFNWIAISD